MRVETERLNLYPISNDEMRSLIEKEAGRRNEAGVYRNAGGMPYGT